MIGLPDVQVFFDLQYIWLQKESSVEKKRGEVYDTVGRRRTPVGPWVPGAPAARAAPRPAGAAPRLRTPPRPAARASKGSAVGPW